MIVMIIVTVQHLLHGYPRETRQLLLYGGWLTIVMRQRELRIQPRLKISSTSIYVLPITLYMYLCKPPEKSHKIMDK